MECRIKRAVEPPKAALISVERTGNMQTRKLGNSDLEITPVGFGAWAIGGSGWDFAWGHQEDEDSIAAIHRSLELGVNWIDTAAVYGIGHSEEIVAQALKDWHGPRPYVFTKCVLRWDDKGHVAQNHTAASIRRECEDSLRRLQIEVIDLYQMHWPPADNGPGLEEAWQTMRALQKEGKVRWIGVSNFDVAQIKRAEKIAAPTTLQPPYSLIRRHFLRAYGLRTPHRRNDPRARRCPPGRRFPQQESGVSRTAHLQEHRPRRASPKSGRPPRPQPRRSRHRLGAQQSSGHRRHRRRPQRQTSRRRNERRRANAFARRNR